MKWNKVMLLNLLLFLATVGLGQESAYLLLLTVAQLIYIPAMLQLIDRKEDWFRAYYPYVAIPAYLSVVLLHITNQTEWDYLFAITYFLFTCFVSTYGISRFLRRGFIQFEEFVIDMGLIYLSIGGIWFFAHITHIDTGFSPMITWLTAIHFHYAAFLLPVFVGFLGRIYKPAYYPLAASIILFSPIVLAIGITFSIWIEVFSVVLYIAGIYTLIFFALKVPLIHCLQKGLIILSFGSLGVTILFSFMYAFGRIWGEDAISIAFMLQFHGFLNSVLFALSGVIGWSIFTPPAKTENWIFPVSKVRGASTVGERILSEIIDNKKGNSYNGLVDQMKIFEPDIHVDSLAPAILDFYEHTLDYRLYAEVKWETWFKPFAIIYRLVSRYVQQINLPLSRKTMEMNGDLFAIKEEVDGRRSPRAWVRKRKGEVIFVALYSWHQTKEKTYMNIALPLPWSSMIGILELNQVGNGLELSSKKQRKHSDSGIYLAWNNRLLALPIEETFYIHQVEDGTLRAQHHMWIFSVPFLKINYVIHHKDSEQIHVS